MGFLKRLFGNSSRDSIQDRVDAVSEQEIAAKSASFEENSDWNNSLFDPVPPPEISENNDHSGGLVGTLTSGFGALKGLQQFAAYLQSGTPFFSQIDQMAQDIPSSERTVAIREAIDGLSPGTRDQLGIRLGTGSDPSTIAGEISSTLGGTNGFQLLLGRLTPNASGVDQSTDWGFGSEESPAAQVNAMEAMKDPVIKETAQALIPALVRAKQAPADVQIDMAQ
jgi:hypothetical protein